MSAIYTDSEGRRYRAVGRVPYSELAAGSRFVMPDERDVRVRQLDRRPERTGDGLADLVITSIYHSIVILLEPIDTNQPGESSC